MTRILILISFLGFLGSCREANPSETLLNKISENNTLDDSAELRLVKRKGTAYEKGKIYGTALREDISLHLIIWDSVVREGLELSFKEVFNIISEKTQFLEAIRKYTPELMEELNGMADGAGVDREDLLCFNLAEEIINYFSNGYESCTNVGIITDSENFIAYNQDLPLFLHGNNIPVILHDDYSYIFTFPGSIGMSGMSKDLAVTVNSLPMLNMNKSGLPLTFMVRKLLTFNSIEQAKKYLLQTPLAIPQNFLLVDRIKMYNLEISANELAEYSIPESEKIVYHTNHPLINRDYRERVATDYLCERFVYLENYFKDFKNDREITSCTIKEIMSVQAPANIYNSETYIRFVGRFPHDPNELPELEINNPKKGEEYTKLTFE